MDNTPGLHIHQMPKIPRDEGIHTGDRGHRHMPQVVPIADRHNT